MKSIMLLMMVCGWLHKSVAQSQGGLDQYYYLNKHSVTIAPIMWYQTQKNWYFEGRYNYEAKNTLSLYAGKTFEKKSTVSYSVSTLAGVAIGEYKGLSIAANADLGYKKITMSLQSQYTFSLKNRNANFIYNWCDLSYLVAPRLYAGVSIQQTNLYKTDAISEKGVFIKAEFGNWSFPLYVFNFCKNERYAVLGLNFALMFKNEKKHDLLYP